ncbi:hypothetical protein BD769DRAFT_1641943 [Suillus cothurnatus]|nr:hypothetical protein BD769DRAFT_1641943 [Suillus cothurnatus]
MCPLDLEAHILGRYEEENAPAGILFRSGLLVMWNCTPSLLLSQSLSALAVGGESQRKWEPFVFEYVNDYFCFPFFLPEDRTMHHPILKLILIPPNSLSNPKVKYVLAKLVTSEGERRYTPQFSYSAFFHAIDEFYSEQPRLLANWRSTHMAKQSPARKQCFTSVSPNHDAAGAVTRDSHQQGA